MNTIWEFSRRRVLRGVVGGAAVSVGLPFLDCFLNANGTALAATGAPLPVRFGTWFWGCGLNPGRWEPDEVGPYKSMKPDVAALAPFRAKVNIYSGLRVHLDGKPNGVHFSGPQGILTGSVPGGGPGTQVGVAPSVDTIIAETIGTRTRFRSLEVACTGNPSHSQSRRNGSVVNPAEVSPAALYTRIFGPEFTDPNAASFTPDTNTILRKSVLSSIADERKDFMTKIGAGDRARMDEYFTSLRALEQQIELQLQKPAPLEACKVPGKVEETPTGTEIATVKANHKLFADLLAHTVACGQTRVINIAFGDATSSLRKVGGTQTHHECTHEEPVDPKLGYQPEMTWYYEQIMESFAYMLSKFDSVKEGDATLLDRMAIMASTDAGYAKLHTLDNIPLITAGGAGGRLKTGIHVHAKGDPATRVGLTMQQIMGVAVSSWGTESNQTNKTITDVVA
jgi:hypothetical protein